MSGIKLSLNQILDKTAALTGFSRSTAQKIVEEKKTLNYWASDIARDEMPEPVVIHLDSEMMTWRQTQQARTRMKFENT